MLRPYKNPQFYLFERLWLPPPASFDKSYYKKGRPDFSERPLLLIA